MVFGLISNGYCGWEINHRMFAFFNNFFTPFAWHNSLQDTTFYNTLFLSFIVFGLTLCMQSLVNTKLSFSMHPYENHGNSLTRKTIFPSRQGNNSGWSGNCTCLDCQSVLYWVSEWSSKFLIVLLQFFLDWLENNKVKSYPSSWWTVL